METWYSKDTGSGQALIIDELTGRTVAVSYDAKDAAMLAAAPKLLECAEEMLEHIDWRRRTEGETAGPNDCTHRARAAIAQARGKS